MELDELRLDGARLAWLSGDGSVVSRATVDGLTLAAVLEAACWGANPDPAVDQLLRGWESASPRLTAARNCLRGVPAMPPAEHSAPEFELRSCPSRQELADPGERVEWDYFLDRFRRGLAQRLGLPVARTHALAAALHDLADNVVEHAGLGDSPDALVAYEFLPAGFAFAVADMGCGVLNSLRTNPTHSAITTDGEALEAAVQRRASRRALGIGQGFADLLRALADLEGRWTFRSGGARLVYDGGGSGARRITSSNSPRMSGFQVAVTAFPSQSVWA